MKQICAIMARVNVDKDSFLARGVTFFIYPVIDIPLQPTV